MEIYLKKKIKEYLPKSGIVINEKHCKLVDKNLNDCDMNTPISNSNVLKSEGDCDKRVRWDVVYEYDFENDLKKNPKNTNYEDLISKNIAKNSIFNGDLIFGCDNSNEFLSECYGNNVNDLSSITPGNGRFQSLRLRFHFILSIFQINRKTRRSNIASCLFKMKGKKKPFEITHEIESPNVSTSLDLSVPSTGFEIRSKENKCYDASQILGGSDDKFNTLRLKFKKKEKRKK